MNSFEELKRNTVQHVYDNKNQNSSQAPKDNWPYCIFQTLLQHVLFINYSLYTCYGVYFHGYVCMALLPVQDSET